MNILHINTYTSGGAGIASTRLHKALLAENIESKYLCLIGDEEVKNSIYRFYDKDQNFVFKLKNFVFRAAHQIRLLPYGRPYIDGLKTPYDITQHPLYKDADIIHLHWVSKFLDWTTFFKNNKKPIVWTLHDMAPFTGGYHCVSDVNVDKAKQLIKNQELKKIELLENQKIYVVGPSQWQSDNAKNSLVMADFKHFNIPNCINDANFRPIDKATKKIIRRRFEITEEEKVLFFVGDQLGLERKGFKYLNQALSILSQKITLLVVGNGFDAKFFEGLQHRIIDIGAVYSSEKLAELYQISDAVISPSIEDNLPNIMLESWACGIPFIGFPIGGIKEYVKTNINGYLCATISAEDLALGIKTVINKTYGIDYENNILNYFNENFNTKNIAQDYIELYKLIRKGNDK
jgi:glycosyltransferase involved in cell wall biosynthesis